MRILNRWSPVLLAAVGACTFSKDVPAGPDGPPLDVLLEPGEVRAGVITRSSELLQGVTARGRIGDVKIYNRHVGIVVAAAGDSRGYHPYGGVILDADRTAGVGSSAYGEVIAALDVVVLRADEVKVINDGLDGNAARVRVIGEPDVMPLFDSLLSGLFEPRTYDMDWTLDYVLEPDAEWVRLEYRVKNRGRETVDFGLRISAFMFGDGTDPFLEGYGFDPPSGGGATADYYAAVGDDVSYIYGSAGDRLSVIITEAGVVATGHGDGFDLIARDVFEYTHYLVIGDGDLSRTQALWRRASGLDAATEVSGVVQDADGTPLAGARVHAVVEAPSVEGRDYVTRTVTDANGRYTMALPPGAYLIRASTDARLVSDPRPVVVADEPIADVALEVGNSGRLVMRITDDEERLLPVKVSIRPVGPSPERLARRYGEDQTSGGLIATIFLHEGQGETGLPPGDYEVFVSRGSEYEIFTQTVTIRAGMPTDLTGRLTRSVSTPGWMSTDTHVHAQLSPDSPDLYPFKARAMVVEGLELPVSTEHEAIGDFNPAIRSLELEPWIHGIVGSEVTTFTYGHFNAFPLVPLPGRPGNGRVDWYGLAPGEMFTKIRENPGDPFIQVNHPRSAAIGGYFSAMGFDQPSFTFSREDYSADFDGIEVMNGCGNGTLEQQPIRDWFEYLNHGIHKVGAASTDNHRAVTGNMGYPRTYVKMPTDDPTEATVEDFSKAFKAGRLTLSCGPFLTIGSGASGIGDLVRADRTVAIDVHLEAPTWMDVDVVEVVVNGVVTATLDLDPPEGVVRFAGTVTATVPPGQDGWVAVAARGDRRHGVWASGQPSFAVTNPIFVDGDGDGLWHGR